MTDRFSTDYLMGVVENLIAPPSFMLDRYFTSQMADTSEEIHFDLINKSRRVAPFVSPLVAGRVMNQEGRVVKTFAPAYTKDKRIFDPIRGFKRAIGERIGGGEFTPEERVEMAIAVELTDQLEILTRRQEIMAMEALRLGQTTVAGDQYPSVIVNFGRDASLSIAALTGTAKWTNSSSTPLKNLRTWAKQSLQKGGGWPRDVFLTADGFDAFVNHPTVQARWQAVNSNVNGTLMTGAPLEEGAVYMGSLEGFNFFQYSGWYVPEDGSSEVEILPSIECVMVSQLLQGIRAYGAIKDLGSLKATPYYAKSWEDNDPSVRYLLLQSAPLMVPGRPNASVGIAGVI